MTEQGVSFRPQPGGQLSAAVDTPDPQRLDFDPDLRRIIAAIQPYTMTSPERVAAVRQAVHYVSRYNIPGSFVQCGVWRGGASMAAAMALLETRDTDRELYLFDTFEGMSEPTEHDLDACGRRAADEMAHRDRRSSPVWAYAPEQDVRQNLASTGYPADRLHFVAGKVEDTLPTHAPDQIAVLRLDTDWYESTRHELEQLVPRVSSLGVLIVDDYGHWQGARRAVDEFLADYSKPALLNRTDYTGRIAVLP